MAKVNSFLLAAILVTALPTFTFAGTEYVVGDDCGWDSDCDYGDWTSGKTLYIGDTLKFNYDPDKHNAVSVDDAGYENCDTSNSFGTYDSSSDGLTLEVKGPYYFICEYHCQKLLIYANSIS